jgi:hypothetical protein
MQRHTWRRLDSLVDAVAGKRITYERLIARPAEEGLMDIAYKAALLNAVAVVALGIVVWWFRATRLWLFTKVPSKCTFFLIKKMDLRIDYKALENFSLAGGTGALHVGAGTYREYIRQTGYARNWVKRGGGWRQDHIGVSFPLVGERGGYEVVRACFLSAAADSSI